MLVLIKAVSY